MSEPFEPLPPTPPIVGLEVDRLDVLRDIDPGDTSYILRAIGNFQVNSSEAVEAIREALGAEDLTALKARAHKIAGSAFNLGVPAAGEAARAIEMAADEGDLVMAGALLPTLEGAMARARDLLLTYRATLEG